MGCVPALCSRSCGLQQTKLMAKIENMEGLVNSAEIIEACDALLFSRGNLGICLDPEKASWRRCRTGTDEAQPCPARCISKSIAGRSAASQLKYPAYMSTY